MKPSVLPALNFRRTLVVKPRKLHKGLDALAHHAIGVVRSRKISHQEELRMESEAILRGGEPWRTVREEELSRHLRQMANLVRRAGAGETPAALRQEALSALSEAAFRKVHLRPYTEQILGVLALENGCLAEMATGEGKTLTLGLAAALAAWRGGPVHIITANDYLVERDAEWLRGFYAFCGLSVGFVTGPMSSELRKRGYSADITYATSKEVVADFLRDRLQMNQRVEPERRLVRQLLQPGRDQDAGLVMRGLRTAIVDEADHILIDEAVTPLIISREAPAGDLQEACRTAAELSSGLRPGQDYQVEARWKDIRLTESCRKLLETRTAGLRGFWRSPARREELIVTALKAKEFFLKGHQYVVDDSGKIIIVDEATGRMMPQRTWKQGLHQAIEAKEGVAMTPPTETLARMSFQKFFRLYPRLCGVTGTAWEARTELWQIYGLPVVVVPTHHPCIRRRPPDRVFATAAEKWTAVVEEIERLHGAGRPVLVGTRSVESSQLLAGMLVEKGLVHQVLNALEHSHEARIIAGAGDANRITIATNMAGRGTDIKLPQGVAAAGGLHVLATEMHDSRRVDRQLFGRAARQGEPGEARMLISLEDDLLLRFTSATVRAMAKVLLVMGPGEAFLLNWARRAQARAGRLSYRQRRQVLAQDDWLEESLSFTGKVS